MKNNKKTIKYRLKDEKVASYKMPMEIEYEDTPKNRLRTQTGILIGHLQEGVYTPSHVCFDAIMADDTVEKVFTKTTVFNENETALIERQYIFIPYVNTEHPYFKEPVKRSVPLSANYTYTAVLSYVDDSCDESIFVHLPITTNATDDITEIISRLRWKDRSLLKDYWVEVREMITLDPDDDEEEESDDIEEQGVPFFNQAGESFLSDDFDQLNLVSFKIVEIKKEVSQEQGEKSENPID